MEKTFLVYCRHVSFVTKGGVWFYSLRSGRREEFWGGGSFKNWKGNFFLGGGHAKNFSDFRKTTAPPPPPVKNEWSLTMGIGEEI